MAARWLSAALVVGCLGWGSAKAAVTYAFYDASKPSQIDLEFTVPDQLSPDNLNEAMSDVGGLFAAEFVVGAVLYHVGKDGPALEFEAVESVAQGEANFDTLTGPPGNGNFDVSGELFDELDGKKDNLVHLGSATISGVPVTAPAIPEPATWVMLVLGAAGIMAASGVARRRRDEAMASRRRPEPAR